MMKPTINKMFVLSLLSILIFLSGCSEKTPPPARLQVLSMIPTSDATITVTPKNDTTNAYSQQINYAGPTGYRSFKPGRYTIRFSVNGTPILNHTYVLGKNSYQTLLVAGMLPDSLRTNPQTFWYTAGKVLAGSENTNQNGFMPQYTMLRDGYGGSKKHGAVRFVNASTTAQKLHIKSKLAGIKHTLIYPLETEPSVLKRNTLLIEFNLAKILLDTHELNLRNGYVHTIITGNARGADSLLKVTGYETPVENN